MFRRVFKRFRRGHAERELDAEVRAYVDQLTEEKVAAGMGRDQARREALMELGGREQVKEAVRDVRFGVWLENLVKDFAYGARLLARSPGFTAVAVLTLALGMGPSLAIFSFVDGILLRSLPYPEPERMVQLFQTSLKDGREDVPVSPPNFVDWHERAQSFESLAAFASTSEVLTGGEPERVGTAVVTPKFFEVFGTRPVMGNTFELSPAKPGQTEVILSYGIWQRRFGGRKEIVGENILVGARPHTVIGVMPRGFVYPAGIEVWLPLVFEPGEMKERNSAYLDVVGRLKAGVSVDQAQAELSTIAAQLGLQYPESNRQFGARVVSLHDEMVRGVRPALGMLSSAVAFVLLIACVNVANLLLVRAVGRERDLAIRSALGAGRTRLMQQLLSEGFLLAVGGGLLGLLVAWLSLDALRQLSPVALPRLESVKLDARVTAFAFALMGLTTLIFGMAPAWQAAGFHASESLKEGTRATCGAARTRLRSVLVVTEIALSLVLLIGAGLVLRSLWSLLSTHPGFDSRNILTADLYLARGKFREHASKAQFAEALVERLSAIPGVETASLATHLPLGGTTMVYGFLVEGDMEAPTKEWAPDRGSEPLRSAGLRLVTPQYLHTLRIPVLRGRGLLTQDVSGRRDVMLVNQTMARKYWPGEDPIGKRIRIARGRTPAWCEIVGIVGDVRHDGLHVPPVPEMYVPLAQQSAHLFRVALRTTGNPASFAQAMREAVWSVDKDQPVTRVRTLQEVIGSSVGETRFYGVLLGVFATLALLLATFGIYSVMAYSVTQRTREIGIRLALGAPTAKVLNLVVGQGLRLAIIGIAVGIAGAAYATRWVEKLLHGVSRTDPATFAAVAGVLLVAVLAACWIPARRATRVDPLVALRHE